MILARALALAAALAACDSTSSAGRPRSEAPRATSTAAAVQVHVETRFPTAERIVAMGDLHGDLAAMRAVLKLAGVADGDHWTGGKTVLVSTGDMLDRGDGERAILDLFESLEKEAEAAGGRVIPINGNHELMNAAGDFRYVTPGGFADFEGVPGVDRNAPGLDALPPRHRARAAALFPGGVYAKKLARHPVVAIVGDNVFVHGGLLPRYAPDVARINDEAATWLAGGDKAGARLLADEDSPIWLRRYSEDPDAEACKLASEALAKLGAKRMVVGHTVMKAITPACDDKIWRIDVGLARHYGGKPAALEIRGDRVTALRAD